MLSSPVSGAAQDASADAPCLQPHGSLDAWTAAFVADGWTVAEGAAREEALPDLGRMLQFVILSAGLSRMEPEELDALLRRTHDEVVTPAFSTAAVLTRDDAAVALNIFMERSRRKQLCVMAARDFPAADERLAASGAEQIGALTVAAELPGVDDEVRRSVGAVRYQPIADASRLEGIVAMIEVRTER